MIVIAGPAGSGKSTAFPVAATGVDFFNIDDYAAVLNGGSYRDIPPEIRARANRECEAFITNHIRERKGFAVETTLRGDITFKQAQQARQHGFITEMRYVALDGVEVNIKRVTARAQAGGHAASPGRIRAIHRASLGNLPTALRQFDRVWVYDNSVPGGPRRRTVTREDGWRTAQFSPGLPPFLGQLWRHLIPFHRRISLPYPLQNLSDFGRIGSTHSFREVFLRA